MNPSHLSRFVAAIVIALLPWLLPSSASAAFYTALDQELKAKLLPLAQEAKMEAVVTGLTEENRSKLRVALENFKFEKDENSAYLQVGLNYLAGLYEPANEVLQNSKIEEGTAVDPLLLAAATISRGKKLNHGKAIGLYNKILKTQPENILALVGLGEIYLAKNFLDLSKQRFSQVLAKDGAHLEALLGMAEFHARNGELENALLKCHSAHGAHPGDPRPLVKIADLLLEQSGTAQIQTILENYRLALNIAPDDPEFLVKISVAMLRMDYDFTASGYVRRALQSDPRHPRVLWLQGLFKEARGDLRKAREFYESAIEGDHNQPDFHYTYANLLGAIANMDFSPQTKNIRKRMYLRYKDLPKSVEEFQKTLKIDKGYKFRNKIATRIVTIEKKLSEIEKSSANVNQDDTRFDEYLNTW